MNRTKGEQFAGVTVALDEHERHDLEAMLAAQDHVYGETRRPVRDIVFHEALFLTDPHEPVDLCTRVRPRPDGTAEVEIASRLGPVERRHVTAVIGAPGERTIHLQPRVLFATGTFPDPENWNRDFAALSAELIDFLHDRGVITVGIDTPSIDLPDSKDLPAHKAVLRHDMAILEGLVLKDVPEGTYELIALPLPLVGFDASPVRAVLRTIKSDK